MSSVTLVPLNCFQLESLVRGGGGYGALETFVKEKPETPQVCSKQIANFLCVLMNKVSIPTFFVSVVFKIHF